MSLHRKKSITDSPLPLLHSGFHNVVVTDLPCSPKKLTFKDKLEHSDSVFRDYSVELESCAQGTNSENSPQRVSHSVSTGDVQLTPYKIAAFCAICFIVGCFTLPIIFYYVNNANNGENLEKVCMFATCKNLFYVL